MRAIFNGTVNRINGEVQEYRYQVYATGEKKNNFLMNEKYLLINFLWFFKDYTNYAIIWSCIDLPENRSMEEGAIIGRQTQLSPAVYGKVDALLTELDLNREEFRFIEHTDEA